MGIQLKIKSKGRSMHQQSIQEMIEKELLKYQKDARSFKPYMQSMKEISIWLQSKGQK